MYEMQGRKGQNLLGYALMMARERLVISLINRASKISAGLI